MNKIWKQTICVLTISISWHNPPHCSFPAKGPDLCAKHSTQSLNSSHNLSGHVWK